MLNKLLSLILFTTAATCAAADRDKPWQAVYCDNIYVHDGDTISADLSLPFRIKLPGRTLRAFGFDAWEVTRTRQTVKVTDEEITKGLKAREALQELLKTGILYIEDATAIQKVKPDPYGRMLTRWWVQQMSYPDGRPTVTWIDVAKWMEERGHCRDSDSQASSRHRQEPSLIKPDPTDRKIYNEKTGETYSEWYRRVGPIIPAGD